MKGTCKTITQFELTLTMDESERAALELYFLEKADTARHDLKPLITSIYLLLAKENKTNEKHHCYCGNSKPVAHSNPGCTGPIDPRFD